MFINNKEKYQVKMIMNSIEDVKSVELVNDEVVQCVQKFHVTLPGYMPTPLISLDGLAEKLGVSKIYVKDESHRFGLNAFKSLGGSYAVAKLLGEMFNIPDEELTLQRLQSPDVADKVQQMTFITATDGNHGRGLAWFTNKLGARSVVLMPKNSVQVRAEAIRNEGATVSVTNLNYDDAVREAMRMAEDNGWIMVQDTAWEGYEKIPAWITQGYSTMAKEAIDQFKQDTDSLLTHVFLQAGVGSMAGGVLGYLVNQFGESVPKTIVVEPNKAACIFKSASVGDGQVHAVKGNHDTMMAGLACGEPNVETWKILRDYAHAYISCSDEVSAVGMRRLIDPIGNDNEIISGESGAVGVGLLEVLMTLKDLAQIKDKLGITQDSIILFFSTEGDTDPGNYEKIIKS